MKEEKHSKGFFLTGFNLALGNGSAIPLALYLIALRITLFSSCDLHWQGDTIASSIANATSSITGYQYGASFLLRSNDRSWLSPKIACGAVPSTSQIFPQSNKLRKKTFSSLCCLLRNFHSQLKIVFLWLWSRGIRDHAIFVNTSTHHFHFPLRPVTIP